MPNGRARLRQWVDRSKLSQREAARLLGFHHTFLSQILRGHRTPGLTNAVKIEQVTGVPVEAWATLPGDESAAVETESVRNSSGDSQ